MARSKNPEQTIEEILNVSARLFVEKGYDQTSIQDILNAMNLSKGGLYHHFKSKEEILDAVMKKRIQYVADRFHHIIQNTQAINAKEKLKKIIYQLVTDEETHNLDTVLASQSNNPYFIVGGLKACVTEDAPIVCQLIEEGNRDGSLQVAQPAFCAEICLLLLNYWANPALFGRNYNETKERLVYLQSVMNLLGLDIIGDDFIKIILKGYEKMCIEK